MSIIAHIQLTVSIRIDPRKQDPWVIELWSQAHRSEKKNKSFRYRFDGLPGLEVPEDKVTLDFYNKYMEYIRFKRKPELFCVEAMKNFAVMFLLKGSILEAFSVIEGDLFIHLSNPYRTVMEQFMGDGSYFFRHTNTEHHVEFIRRFARMCAIGMSHPSDIGSVGMEYDGDNLDTILRRLDAVGIYPSNFSNNLMAVVQTMQEREEEQRKEREREEQRRLEALSEWLSTTFF